MLLVFHLGLLLIPSPDTSSTEYRTSSHDADTANGGAHGESLLTLPLSAVGAGTGQT